MKNFTALQKQTKLYHLVIFVSLGLMATKTIESNSHRAQHLIKQVFGEHGTQTKQSHQDEIHELIIQLSTCSDYQKIVIAKKAARRIELERKEVVQQLIKDPQNEPAYQYKLFLLNSQISHLDEYRNTELKTIPLKQKLRGMFSEWYNWIITKLYRLFKKHYLASTTDIAERLDFYAHFEREHILHDYTKTLYLLASYKTHPLPKLMMFWSNEQRKKSLISRSREFNKPTKVQGEIAIAEEIGIEAADQALMTAADITLAESTQVAAERAAQALLNPTNLIEAATETFEETLGSTASQIEESLLVDVETSIEKEAAVNEGEATESSAADKKKDVSTKRSARRQARAQERAKVATEEQSALENPQTSTAKKGWIKTKQFIRAGLQKAGITSTLDFVEDFVTGPVNDWYKAHVYDTFIGPMEKNALKETLDAFPHWVRPALDIGLQMNIMQGGNIVTYWENKDDAEFFKTLAEKNAKLSNLSSVISNTLKAQKAQKLNLARSTFGQKMTDLNGSSYQQMSEQLDAERAYRDNAFFSTKPQRSFMVKSDAMTIDQQFTNALMLTPDTVNLKKEQTLNGWRNIFKQGNWVFSPSLNSFVQTDIIALQGQSPTDLATKALYNSIFKEFYPSSAYKIVVECSITEISYPCVVGVIFNNARWISGVPDRFHQHRFAGIFAKDNSLYGVLAESKNSTDKPSKFEWPALQLVNKPEQFIKPENKISGTTPLTLTFTITTSTTEASCTIQTRPEDKGIVLVEKNLLPSTFTMHGIGFMAAGCKAQFTVKEPKELTYSQAECEALKKFLSSEKQGV